ncbi:hypothetical protein, partial [Bartonella doshiae]|uniref:hypothetical protein n=1 Tax=Bartonella doshiae TaxID=33044 RepID=UPI001ABB16B6
PSQAETALVTTLYRTLSNKESTPFQNIFYFYKNINKLAIKKCRMDIKIALFKRYYKNLP